MALLYPPLASLRLIGVLLMLGLLLFPSALSAQGRDISEYDVPPPGFQWRSCDVIECFFLVPDDWDFQRLEGTKILKYQMMPKTNNRKVPPVVRINIIQNTESLTGLSAERHIELFMRQLERESKILDVWEKKSGLLNSTAVLSLYLTRAESMVKKFHLLIRNDRTGTLYVLTFESAPEYWDQDWRVIEWIVSRLRLTEDV